jgi:hypothetical protein
MTDDELVDKVLDLELTLATAQAHGDYWRSSAAVAMQALIEDVGARVMATLLPDEAPA